MSQLLGFYVEIQTELPLNKTDVHFALYYIFEVSPTLDP